MIRYGTPHAVFINLSSAYGHAVLSYRTDNQELKPIVEEIRGILTGAPPGLSLCLHAGNELKVYTTGASTVASAAQPISPLLIAPGTLHAPRRLCLVVENTSGLPSHTAAALASWLPCTPPQRHAHAYHLSPFALHADGKPPVTAVISSLSRPSPPGHCVDAALAAWGTAPGALTLSPAETRASVISTLLSANPASPLAAALRAPPPPGYVCTPYPTSLLDELSAVGGFPIELFSLTPCMDPATGSPAVAVTLQQRLSPPATTAAARPPLQLLCAPTAWSPPAGATAPHPPTPVTIACTATSPTTVTATAGASAAATAPSAPRAPGGAGHAVLIHVVGAPVSAVTVTGAPPPLPSTLGMEGGGGGSPLARRTHLYFTPSGGCYSAHDSNPTCHVWDALEVARSVGNGLPLGTALSFVQAHRGDAHAQALTVPLLSPLDRLPATSDSTLSPRQLAHAARALSLPLQVLCLEAPVTFDSSAGSTHPGGRILYTAAVLHVAAEQPAAGSPAALLLHKNGQVSFLHACLPTRQIHSWREGDDVTGGGYVGTVLAFHEALILIKWTGYAHATAYSSIHAYGTFSLQRALRRNPSPPPAFTAISTGKRARADGASAPPSPALPLLSPSPRPPSGGEASPSSPPPSQPNFTASSSQSGGGGGGEGASSAASAGASASVPPAPARLQHFVTHTMVLPRSVLLRHHVIVTGISESFLDREAAWVRTLMHNLLYSHLKPIRLRITPLGAGGDYTVEYDVDAGDSTFHNRMLAASTALLTATGVGVPQATLVPHAPPHAYTPRGLATALSNKAAKTLGLTSRQRDAIADTLPATPYSLYLPASGPMPPGS